MVRHVSGGASEPRLSFSRLGGTRCAWPTLLLSSSSIAPHGTVGPPSLGLQLPSTASLCNRFNCCRISGSRVEDGLLDFLVAFGRGGDADHAAAVGHVVDDAGHGPDTAPSPMCTWSRTPTWPAMTT